MRTSLIASMLYEMGCDVFSAKIVREEFGSLNGGRLSLPSAAKLFILYLVGKMEVLNPADLSERRSK